VKKKGTLFGKPRDEVIKKPGSETKRAEEHGKSLHEQAEEDSHSSDKRIRGKGTFALNAQSHKIGKKPKAGGNYKRHWSQVKTKKAGRKKTARKKG
jgi:nucleoid DNA-binding protein